MYLKVVVDLKIVSINLNNKPKSKLVFGENLIERNFPVADPNISIDKLISILGEVMGVALMANGTIALGTGVKTQVHTLKPIDSKAILLVSIRNYAADPHLGKKQIGILVKGDQVYEGRFERNLGPILEYFI